MAAELSDGAGGRPAGRKRLIRLAGVSLWVLVINYQVTTIRSNPITINFLLKLGKPLFNRRV